MRILSLAPLVALAGCALGDFAVDGPTPPPLLPPEAAGAQPASESAGGGAFFVDEAEPVAGDAPCCSISPAHVACACCARRQVACGCRPVGWVWGCGEDPCGAMQYFPQEGDIVLLTTKAPVQEGLYLLYRTNHPHHSGLIVRRSTGELALLEAGGETTVTIEAIEKRLYEYVQSYKRAKVWIRRIRRPLTPDESWRLTCFAENQDGKRFVSLHQFTPLLLPGRPLPPTRPDQRRWFCSEIVVGGLQAAGRVSGAVRPAATMPADLFHDRRYDFSPGWTPPLEWTAFAWPAARKPILSP